MKTIAFHTLGCKVNFTETSTIARKFVDEGYKILDFKEKADVYVIHSCVVTAIAEKKCIASVRQAYSRNPEAKVAIIGCMSELQKESLKSENSNLYIVGNQDKFSLTDIVENRSGEVNKGNGFVSAYSLGGRTRMFFKIQDGCDYFCSYCTIPNARGRSRSDTVSDTIKKITDATKDGCRELVLSGINIGDFGRKNGESFLDFLKALSWVKTIDRIRISSIEPDLFSEDVFEFILTQPNIMPHFHLPLQSGTDSILKLMNRKYDTKLFASRVEMIQKKMPHACIATDIITGFPGETLEEFKNGMRFLQSLPVSYMHVFSFSPRSHTKAFELENKIPAEEKKERSKALHLLSAEKKKYFYSQHINTKRNVLFESGNRNGYLLGFTDNYIKVRTDYQSGFRNCIASALLTGSENDEILNAQIV
jgi:threonylcarbamoyladenosine tRNA methylthiotransferase MtaB